MFYCLMSSMTVCGRARAGTERNNSSFTINVDFQVFLSLSQLEHDHKPSCCTGDSRTQFSPIDPKK